MSLSLEEATNKEKLLSLFNFLKYKAEEDNGLVSFLTAKEIETIIAGYKRFYSQNENQITSMSSMYMKNQEEIEKTKRSQQNQGYKIRDLEAGIQTLQEEIEILKERIK